MEMSLKYKYKKLRVLFRKLFDSHRKDYSKEEIIIKATVKALLKNSNVNIFIVPNVEKVHIECGDYWVVVSNQEVKFTNHKVFFDILVSQKLSNLLFNIIYEKVERERTAIEESIFSFRSQIMYDTIANLQMVENDDDPGKEQQQIESQ
jgi:hypothetical protein